MAEKESISKYLWNYGWEVAQVEIVRAVGVGRGLGDKGTLGS